MKGSRGAEKNRLYYKLSPVYGSGTIYVPVDTKIFMRPVLSRREAMDLIHRSRKSATIAAKMFPTGMLCPPSTRSNSIPTTAPSWCI